MPPNTAPTTHSQDEECGHYNHNEYPPLSHKVPCPVPPNNDNTFHPLPSPHQQWSHSTCSISKLERALNDSNITAIETDILMGTHVPSQNDAVQPTNKDTEQDADDEEQLLKYQEEEECLRQPIMAHPPYNSSDLTFPHFHSMLGERLTKHLKLDFKDVQSIPLVLSHILSSDNYPMNCTSKSNSSAMPSPSSPLMEWNPKGMYTIYLNADILPGPGFRPGLDRMAISAEVFVSTCLKFIEQSLDSSHHFAFSLGWKVDCRTLMGYDSRDIDNMRQLILEHELNKRCKGVVLAVNARVLAKNCHPFNESIFDIPGLQLLVWTGTGEPPISSKQIQLIKNYFESNGYGDRVGYDCQIASNPVTGAFYDLAVHVVGLFWNIQRLVSHTVLSLRDQALALTS